MSKLFDPEHEIMPGVRWGRPEWIPSPAFWSALTELADEDADGFINRGSSLSEQIGFCLLGGYGITAEVNIAAHSRLKSAGIYKEFAGPTRAEIEALLIEPLIVEGKRRRYRFPHQRSARIVAALRELEISPPDTSSSRKFRASLMKLSGIGPKTASWIARNYLGSDDVAILDVHIIRAGIITGLFSPNDRLPRDYEAMEARFLLFCTVLGVKASLLDAVMWRAMRNMRRTRV